MSKNSLVRLVEEEKIMNKIHVIRNHKVMLDFDLAEMYGVETKRLNEQLKRNLKRFHSTKMAKKWRPSSLN
jgi:hypothetical protein